MSSALVFQSTTFDVIDRNGQPWVKSSQLATALGYSDERKVTQLYNRNSDEFTNDMSVVLNLGTPGNLPIQTRIFSLRGCHLLAMFARTAVAKAFRVWVLDVLETLNRTQRPALESTATPSTADERAPLRALVHAWAQMSGIAHQALWPQVKAHFQLSRIDDLPKEWIPDALAFVQGKIDAVQGARPKALPAPEPKPDYAQVERKRMAEENIVQLRRVCNEFHFASDRLFNMFIGDDLIQSLNIAANLSNYALLGRYVELAGR